MDETAAPDPVGSGPGKRAGRLGARANHVPEASAAARGVLGAHPAVGVIQRHLTLLTQQMADAHSAADRRAAEGEALRQQLADLQGIPVDQIAVPTSAALPTTRARKRDRAAKQTLRTESAAAAVAPASTSVFAKPRNYFYAENLAVTRRRRQMAALVVVAVIGVLWTASKLGYVTTPGNVSKEGVFGGIPLLGSFSTYFISLWMLYRMVRISSKGVGWIFPSEPKRRAR
jgi:hypothetical protein